jgi:cytidylate kinase
MSTKFEKELDEIEMIINERIDEHAALQQIAEARATLRANLVENRVTDPALLDAIRTNLKEKVKRVVGKANRVDACLKKNRDG